MTSPYTTKREVRATMVDRIEGCGQELRESPEILDLSRSPSTRQHKAFTILLQTRDTGQFRGRPGTPIRIEGIAVVRLAYRLNPKDNIGSQAEADDDVERIRQVLLTWQDQDPLPYTEPRFLADVEAVHPKGEWLMVDMQLSMKWSELVPEAG